MNLTVRHLAEIVGGELCGDGDLIIQSAKPLTEAGPGDITLVDSEKHYTAWKSSLASAAVVSVTTPLNGKPLIKVPDPLFAFANIVTLLTPRSLIPPPRMIDASAIIHPTARLGEEVVVEPYVVIGANSTVGDRTIIRSGTIIGNDCHIGTDTILHPHVVLYDCCTLGNRVIIHSNAVIGADGFGFRTQNGKHEKVPQLGSVEIGNDVEIGACSTIDRGTFGVTRIGEGTKIDNLVMIGHNCQIGKHNLLVSQVGIAGSCITGDYVILAGQVGVADHVTIGKGAVIGAQSGVPQDIPPDSRMLGSPARPDREALRMLLALERLPELIREVRGLKKQLGLEEAE